MNKISNIVWFLSVTLILIGITLVTDYVFTDIWPIEVELTYYEYAYTLENHSEISDNELNERYKNYSESYLEQDKTQMEKELYIGLILLPLGIVVCYLEQLKFKKDNQLWFDRFYKLSSIKKQSIVKRNRKYLDIHKEWMREVSKGITNL